MPQPSPLALSFTGNPHSTQTMSTLTLYTADTIITQNANRDIIDKGGIVVEGSRILSLGHADMLEVMYPHARRVDLGKAAIMPGLINSHTHASMSLLRGYSDDKKLMDWLTQDIFPIEDKFNREIIAMSAKFSFAEMIRSGTTAFYDMYMLEDGIYQAADEMGMRGACGESMSCYYPSLCAPSQEALMDILRERAEAWSGHPRLRHAILPHAPYTSTPELLQEMHQLAKETGSLFGMHLAESESETEFCLKNYNKRPIPYCKDIGLLEKGNSFFHVIHANDEEIDMLAESGIIAVHNPASNMKLASGCAPVSKMHAKGVTLALGTDGPASNNAQNMQREMYVASLLHKFDEMDSTAVPAQRVLDMATLGGAAALGDPLIGALEPGMRADFIALDLTQPNMQPVHNIISNVVYAASGMENILTVIDGKELYRDGKFLHCDYTALCSEMEKLVQWVKAVK